MNTSTHAEKKSKLQIAFFVMSLCVVLSGYTSAVADEAAAPPEKGWMHLGDGLHRWLRSVPEHGLGDWIGVRSTLAEYGISLEGALIADWASNWHGGTNTNGSSFQNLFIIDLSFDTEVLFGLEGGTIFVEFYNQNGEDPAVDSGDFQGHTNIAADGRTEIAELWYEQFLANGMIRVKVGKVEANAEFAYVDNGGEFINSSMGFSPTIFILPTYPDPAMSVNVFVYPNDNLYMGVGVFDGALQEGKSTGMLGPKTFFDDPSDLFVIGEAGFLWAAGGGELPGRFAVGAWGHTGTFTRFDGGTKEGTTGFYLLVDQTLWNENPGDEEDGQGIGMFFQYGYANPDVSSAEHHVGIGAVWAGALPGRNDDIMGIGATYVRFSDEPGAGFTDEGETTLELFYKVQVLPWASIKPDLQYIFNPGGVDLKDALAGTLRVEVAF